MKRLGASALTLLLIVGCASDADKAQWNEALKDLRGDNMRMRGDGPTTSTPSDRAAAGRLSD